MNQSQFKSNLDSRGAHGLAWRDMCEAAHQWADEANQGDKLIKWKWDVGLKLDYDGDICRIDSRFYPPHKSDVSYGKYHGTISVMIGDGDEYLHEIEVEAETLDELKEIVEKEVSEILDKIHSAIRLLFE